MSFYSTVFKNATHSFKHTKGSNHFSDHKPTMQVHISLSNILCVCCVPVRPIKYTTTSLAGVFLTV